MGRVWQVREGVARDQAHLEVAVEDPLLVEVLEAEEGLGGVEARLL